MAARWRGGQVRLAGLRTCVSLGHMDAQWRLSKGQCASRYINKPGKRQILPQSWQNI